jgi:hypothetical protein
VIITRCWKRFVQKLVGLLKKMELLIERFKSFSISDLVWLCLKIWTNYV